MVIAQLLLLCSFLLIFYIGNSSESLNDCVQPGFLCNALLPKPCCDDTTICHRDRNELSRCLTRAEIGMQCNTNKDCTQIWYSKCSDGQCVCETDYKVRNGSCVASLDAFCLYDIHCVDENSLCIDNKCQCAITYTARGDTCVKNTIGMACNDDQFCDKVKYTFCSSTDGCQCLPKTVALTPVLCASILESPCEDETECITNNSTCINNKCLCKENLIAYGNNKCLLVEWDISCYSNYECEILLPHSICSEQNKCVCDENHVPQNGKCAPLLGIECTNEKCATRNANCIDNKCQCRANYINWDSKCLPTILGESCEENSDCRKIAFSTCRTNKCECIKYFVKFNKTKCVQRLGLYCSNNNHCSMPNSICIDNECQCNTDFMPLVRKRCLPTKVGLNCEYSEDCRKIPFAECIGKVCTCRSNYINVNGTCASLLDGFCWNSTQCFTKNSDCIDHKCQCTSNSTKWYNTCMSEYLNVYCDRNEHCQFIEHAKCSDANKCECKRGSKRASEVVCAPELNGFCLDKEMCADLNAMCVNHQCVCKNRYIDSDDKCIPTVLNLKCYSNSDCRRIKFSECIDNTCQCRKNYIQMNEYKCAALYGEYCFENTDCFVNNSVCIDRTCRCVDNFVRLFNDKCLSGRLNIQCEFEVGCDDAASICQNNECFCIKNHIAVDKVCLPLLYERCTTGGLCAVKNSICIDDHCQCSPHYTAQSNDICAPAQLKCNCDNNMDCVAIVNSKCVNGQCICKDNYAAKNGVCCPIKYDCPEKPCIIKENFCLKNESCIDYKNRYCLKNQCVCQPNNIEIYEVCQPILSGFCSKNEDCITVNSACIGNKCECEQKFLPNGNNTCISISLGMKCVTDFHCSFIRNAICSEHRICVCEKNNFALNNFICSKKIGERCTSNLHCNVLNSHCIEGLCQCKDNFSAISEGQCVETSAAFDCNVRAECSDALRSDCSSKGKCICKKNYFSTVDDACLPLLRGFCWKDSQCFAENSVCRDYSCQCRSDSLQVADNLCVLK